MVPSEAKRAKALDILADTRRRIYGLLAEGPQDTDEEPLEEE